MVKFTPKSIITGALFRTNPQGRGHVLYSHRLEGKNLVLVKGETSQKATSRQRTREFSLDLTSGLPVNQTLGPGMCRNTPREPHWAIISQLIRLRSPKGDG